MGGKSEKPLVEKIRFHLEEQIIAGRLKPRQRLVEEEIAREMSVSRSRSGKHSAPSSATGSSP
jgi:DNA-binding GntR family transcriptional regulator